MQFFVSCPYFCVLLKSMKSILSTFLIVIFLALAMVHFYWASGGQWAFDQALPTTEQGVRILNPGIADSVVVGLALLLFSICYLLPDNWLRLSIPYKIQRVGLWMIPIIFTLRAIGDFNYVGFFKQIRTTEFARLDTFIYSPLCLSIALIGFVFLRLKRK